MRCLSDAEGLRGIEVAGEERGEEDPAVGFAQKVNVIDATDAAGETGRPGLWSRDHSPGLPVSPIAQRDFSI